MRFTVLGALGATGPEGPAELSGEGQRRLLALLLARAGEVVSTDRLVDGVWGDDPPANPTAALHNRVSRLRRALAAVDDGAIDRIETAPPGYRLRLEADELDAAVFEADLTAADGLSAPEAAERLRAALELWRGPAYEEFLDSPLIAPEIIRLDELRVAAEERLGRVLIDTGRPDEAVARLSALVEAHPLHEGPREALMLALVAVGREPAALDEYQSYRRLLAEELGLEPSAAMRQLEAAVLNQEIGRTPTVVGAARPAPDRRSGFAGLEVRYLPVDGANPVAYAQVGTGPDLVVVPAWVTSLEVIAAGRDPRSSLFERLTDRFRLTLYDRRGTGLTGGEVEDHSLEGAVRELEAVLALVDGPVSLLGVSQAGPVVAALAARRPELVDRLVLLGTYADGAATFGDATLVSSVVGLVEAHWGLGSKLLGDLYRPGASEEATLHMGRVLRDSASGPTAAAYLRAVYETDVTGELESVRAPTLVMHYRGDRVIPFRGGQHLASHLPDARLVPLEGAYHLPDARDLDLVVGLIDDHLLGP